LKKNLKKKRLCLDCGTLVLAGKIFRLKEKVTLEGLADKLKNFRMEEKYRENDFELTLTTEIRDLNLKLGKLEGKILRDEIIHIRQKDTVKPIPRTVESSFFFYEYGGNVLLTVLEKKRKANNLANLLSRIIFGELGFVVEIKIPPENLKKYHEQNFEGTKIIFFSDVDIPNIEKLSLYGENLANTSLYMDFLSHGSMWYVVITSKKHGYVVGLTGNGIVTIFNRISPEEFLTYIIEEIFPLTSTEKVD